MNYVIEEVVSFPHSFQPGILYWSKEFEMSAHVCACGCSDVIQLPVDSQNYTIILTPTGPTLRPSVGNWGVCDAHYYITAGNVEWMPKWTPTQIAIGRAAEDARRQTHYEAARTPLLARIKGFLVRLWRSLWS